jgi:hypothetical protein
MSEGQGSISFSKRSGGSGGGGGGTLTTASNGLSVTGTDVRLGTLVGGGGAPFANARELSMNGFVLEVDNPHFVYQNFDGNGAIHHYITPPPNSSTLITRIIADNTVNIIPWEELLDNNPNGNPPQNDLIYIQGFNIDSQFSSTKASWTQRMEYGFNGIGYEYHIQWSDNVIPRLNRLMSMTFKDHGGPDENLVEFQGAFAINNLGSNIVYWSASTGVNFSQVAIFSGSLQFANTVFDDGITPSINYFTVTGAADMIWQNFKSYVWADNIAGHTGLSLTFLGTNGVQLSPVITSKNFYIESAQLVIYTGSGANPTLNFSGANNATIFTDFGVGEMVLQTPSGGYQIRMIANGSTTLTLNASHNAIFSNAIQTADPGLGAALWELGAVQTATSALDTTRYVQVSIGGVVVKLAVIV